MMHRNELIDRIDNLLLYGYACSDYQLGYAESISGIVWGSSGGELKVKVPEEGFTQSEYAERHKKGIYLQSDERRDKGRKAMVRRANLRIESDKANEG